MWSFASFTLMVHHWARRRGTACSGRLQLNPRTTKEASADSITGGSQFTITQSHNNHNGTSIHKGLSSQNEFIPVAT
eukprot:m.369033 g.369033  ORF g.369033 m.369033 type:complete len:77 (-) comp16672_c1_seq23:767-997(-)